MKSNRHIFTVESHTMGESLRLIVGGFPKVKGSSMPEKKAYFMEHYDDLHRALILEPRGHGNMYGAVLTPACHPDADFGVIFMHGDGYHNMCGHGTIATNTIMVETGMIEVEEPTTSVTMETPAGLVSVNVNVGDGKAKSVSFENVPAFLYRKDIEVDVPGYGKLTMDISFGGSFFAIIDSAKLGLDICTENASKLTDAGMAILKAANEQIEIIHPELPHITTIDLCEIYGPAKSPDTDMQNITIFDGQIDRSPCGTGTCAKVATLWARGELALNEPFVYESVINTKFIGKAKRETTVGPYKAIIPEITGSAYITGYGQYVIDEDDPVKYGFSLQ